MGTGTRRALFVFASSLHESSNLGQLVIKDERLDVTHINDALFRDGRGLERLTSNVISCKLFSQNGDKACENLCIGKAAQQVN